MIDKTEPQIVICKRDPEEVAKEQRANNIGMVVATVLLWPMWLCMAAVLYAACTAPY